MATARLLNYFFTATSVLRRDGTTGGVRFLQDDQPTEDVMKDFLESIAFLRESDSRAKLYTGATNLSTEQGLVVLATDAQAKANQAQLADRSLVVQPHQLPTLDAAKLDGSDNNVAGTDAALGGSTKTNLTAAGLNLETHGTLIEEVDSSTTTKNHYFLRLSNYFLNWLDTALIQETNKVLVTSNDTTSGYLLSKLAAGDGITLSEANDGGDEDVTIAATGQAKVSANDTTINYLLSKIVAGTGITVNELNDGANETLEIVCTITDTNTDESAKVSANDTTAGYLNGKLVAGDDISLTENNDGSNETLTIALALGDHNQSNLTSAVQGGGTATISSTTGTYFQIEKFLFIHVVVGLSITGDTVSSIRITLPSSHTIDMASGLVMYGGVAENTTDGTSHGIYNTGGDGNAYFDMTPMDGSDFINGKTYLVSSGLIAIQVD